MSDISTVSVRTTDAGIHTLGPKPRRAPRRGSGSPARAITSTIARRALQTLILLFGVTVISFALVRVTPGDPARLLLPVDATAAQVRAMQQTMGLDQPLVVQYLQYVGNVLHGDLGYSYTYQESVSTLIGQALPMTALLGLVGIALSLCVSVPLGMTAGIRRGTVWDTVSMLFALLGQSVSAVWLSVGLVLVFAVKLHWLPTAGSAGPQYLILPAICVAAQDYALTTRMLRSGMIGALQEDFIMAARARGIRRTRIYGSYALKNAVLPLITVVGSQIGMVLAGSLVIETAFNWPGIGLLLSHAITSRDFQVIQSVLLVSGFIYAICALVVDVLYTVIDRRIAFQ